MAANPLSVKKTDPNGVTYADPAKPDFTVRFRNTQSKKTLNGVSVDNYLSEIIYNDNNSIEVATGVDAVDAISVRLRVSGALASSTRITEIITALALQVGTWNTQHVFQGFNPTTAPAVPAA